MEVCFRNWHGHGKAKSYYMRHRWLLWDTECFALSLARSWLLNLICTKCSEILESCTDQYRAHQGSDVGLSCDFRALLCIKATWRFTKDHARRPRSRSTYQCRGPSASQCAAESASTSSISAAHPGFCLHWRPPSPRSVGQGEPCSLPSTQYLLLHSLQLWKSRQRRVAFLSANLLFLL